MTGAVDLEVLDATVFVDCRAGDVNVSEVVAEILHQDSRLSSTRVVRPEILVEDNEDADAHRAADWPGGFLFFPCVIEIYGTAQASRHARAQLTAALLSSLWARGIAAVAACEYEDLLPASAGAGDRALPWPTAPAG